MNVDYFGITISEQDAQGLYEWMRDSRGKAFWDLIKQDHAACNDKATSMDIDKTLHPDYSRMVREQSVGMVNAYKNIVSAESNLKYLLQSLKKSSHV